MFTLFDMLRLFGFLGGAALGARIGFLGYGVFGAIIGGATGLTLGGIIGQLPILLVLRMRVRQFRGMTNDELRTLLHNEDCITLNVVLLELKRRGADIENELGFVCSLLTSSEMSRRVTGWAALTSVFPSVANKIPDYSPARPVEQCRRDGNVISDGGKS